MKISTYFSKLTFLLLIAGGNLLKAQPNGPDAPNYSLGWNGNGFEFNLSNSVTSNNYNEFYSEVEPNCACSDPVYNFQGYLVLQLINSIVALSELFDTSKARIVYQCDKADSIGNEYSYFQNGAQCDSSLVFAAANSGIQHNFTVVTDGFSGQAFTTGDSLCFAVLAYAHNSTMQNCNFQLAHISSKRNVANTCVFATSVREHEKIKLRAWPSPTTGEVNIELPNEEFGQVFVSDIAGNIVLTKTGQGKITFDLSDHVPGIYFAVLRTAAGNYFGKVLKN
jgi:hypothetical protein